MRRSKWTPSIVPNGDDQTVYLVAEISANTAALGLRAPTKLPIWKRSFRTCSPASTLIQSELSPSIPPSGGPKTFRKCSPRNPGRCDLQMHSIQDFVEGHEGNRRQLTLRFGVAGCRLPLGTKSSGGEFVLRGAIERKRT